MRKGKLLGGTLLVIGTSMGGGMLALPTVSAAPGFTHSVLQLLFCWIIMSAGALVLLEVNLLFPSGSNLISMAKHSLGRFGAAICWICTLLLFYSLLAAYIASGAQVTRPLFVLLKSAPHLSLQSLLFTLLFGAIVYRGIRHVDWFNRGFMTLKLAGYFALVAMVMPFAQQYPLISGQPLKLLPALSVMMTSFGFGSIIPSLREYFQHDIKQLRLAIMIGSSIPLLFYILWIFVVLGSVPSNDLIVMLHSNNAASAVAETLTQSLHQALISRTAHAFTSICVITSFLSVSLGLFDFIADGCRLPREGKNKIKIAVLTFLPPLSLVICYPRAFILGLEYAGTICLVLLVLMPCLMAWRTRYHQQQQQSPLPAPLNQYLLALVMLLAIVCIVISALTDLKILS